jgi:type VI secretion system protein ImpA
MASAPLLDFGPLLAPIPGEFPAGGSIPFEIREKLLKGREEDNPEDFAADDPMRPATLKKAEWPVIITLAQATLTQTSKDLLVAARLTEALVKQHGFAGLRDGLHLLRLLVEECWDRLNPPLEDGDMEVRAGPFHWLDTPDRGARFPNTLRLVPLVALEGKQYHLLHWRQSQDSKAEVTREEFEKAIQASPVEHWQTLAEDIAQSLEELSRLAETLNAKMGPAAPGLTGIRPVLEECQGLVKEILLRKCRVLATETDIPNEATGSETAPRTRAAGSRSEVYRQLAEAAAHLQRLEPHSPIPYLIQRAVELGALPFPQMIKALIRDANVLAELNRELGIEDPPPEK